MTDAGMELQPVNGDGELDISDPSHLLGWLFGDGVTPVTLCAGVVRY